MTLKSTLTLALAIGLTLSPPALVAGEGGETQDLYAKKCAMCHGSDGVAKPMWAKQGARSFNDPAWQKERTDEQILTAIRDGSGKSMQAYKDKLTAEEITALVKYIRTMTPAK